MSRSCIDTVLRALLLFACALGAPPAHAGLMAYLTFEEPSGFALDRSNHGRIGKLLGTAPAIQRAAGMSGFGQALFIDGQNGRLWIPGIDGAFPTYTLAWWQNPASISPNRPTNWNQIIGGTGGVTFFAHSENNGGWYMGTANAVGRFEASQTAGSLIVGQWTHHAYVYDGASGKGAYYNNGVLRVEGPQGAPVPFTGLQFGAVGPSTIHGLLDEIAFFDVALNAASIASLADKTRTPLTLPAVLPTPTPTPLPRAPGADRLLLGMHFIEDGLDPVNPAQSIGNVVPFFGDYLQYTPEDLAHVSYADFWRWWFQLERYKGDEQGMERLDALAHACIQRGLEVKIDLAMSTWFTENRDWMLDQQLAYGPPDADDWIHLCEILGRRYRGIVHLWVLQGEANGLDSYWRNMPMSHAQRIYETGARAFKRVDPATAISISGASPSAPREDMDEWYRGNLTTLRGLYDDTPMNYFADINGADPYNGLINYHDSLRSMLDDLALHDVTIGSGESSVQWLEDSYAVPAGSPPTVVPNPATAPLSQYKQAWRLNESMGTFYNAGGSKFVWWATEFAPGNGWPWRWGFRKYQDWWGIWPAAKKITGTNIVFGYDNPDGRTVDLRPGWTRPTDPYQPVWQIYKFWAQASPPGSQSIRLPVQFGGASGRVLGVAAFLQLQDRAVVLLQHDTTETLQLTLDLAKSGWPIGTPLNIAVNNEKIAYGTGDRVPGPQSNLQVAVSQNGTAPALQFNLPPVSGFTTLAIQPSPSPVYAASLVSRNYPAALEIGEPLQGNFVLSNIGSAAWTNDSAVLALYEAPLRENFSPEKVISTGAISAPPGQSAIVPFALPLTPAAGREVRHARMHAPGVGWFGPVLELVTVIADSNSATKLFAHRELGHIRLKWFAPVNRTDLDHYEIYRAAGFEQPMVYLASSTSTEYIDASPPALDHPYYYQVVAVRKNGHRERPSRQDNAAAITQPRFYDAEITAHTLPARIQKGTQQLVQVTLKNTGTKPWVHGEGGVGIALFAMREWGSYFNSNYHLLPAPVAPGASVTLSWTMSHPTPGRFENHYVMAMDVPAKGRAWFGTPLLAEIEVHDAATANPIWLSKD